MQYAQEISDKLNINCKFIATDILQISMDYYGKFDYIIITIGSLCWFKELNSFFGKVSNCLNKNGKVLINELHPITNMLGLDGEENYNKDYPTNIVNSYFNKEWIETDGMYYMTKEPYKSKPFTSYTHSFSEIINSMIDSSLYIEKIYEYERDISGLFKAFNNKGIPLSYIVEAKK